MIVLTIKNKYFLEFEFEKYDKMNSESWNKFYHRLVETFKHVFAMRHSFGDEEFVDMTEVRH